MSARLQTMVPIFLLVALAIVVTNVFPFRQMMANERSIDLGLDQLGQIRAENARLESEVEALSTTGELERLAREDLGYVREGEIAYVITNPSQPEVAETVEAALPERLPWYRAAWDFLTGQDLVTTSF